MKNILFVCTGNSCRSVMAEGLFRKMTDHRAHEFSASSAGISAIDGFFATEETVNVMKVEGVDVSGHRSRRLTPEMIELADKVYVMEKIHREWILKLVPHAKNKVFLLTEFSPSPTDQAEKADIPDPIRMSNHFYKNVLNWIRDCVNQIVEDL